MSDDSTLWQRNEPDSPCIKLCMLDPVHKICIGCGRTGDEIAAWGRLDASSRQDVLALLPERLEQIKPKRGQGRRSRRK